MKAKYLNNITKYALAIFLSLLAHQGMSQQLSPKAEISILTIGPGSDELYSAFGHSAIRVYDPANGIDWAYNYGTFDFNRPNFYLNFARGYLVYKLAVQDFRRLKEYYVYNNRSIIEQVLDLNATQKQSIFNYLQNNAKPENADYFYDYFYDNCATKIGDVFVEALGEEFKFDDNFVDEPGLTVRAMTDRYSAVYFPWGKLGIDLCLGMPMDVQLTNMEYTYLPDYVYKAFSLAKINGTDNWQPVVTSINNIFDAEENSMKAPIFTPKLVFWLSWVVVAFLSLHASRKKISLRWLDFLLFLIIGFLGLFILVLWLATDHTAAAWNLNLLWAWPTHLFAAFWVVKRSRPRWINWYLLVTAILGVVLIVLWPVVPQALNYALIPIVLLIATRAISSIFSD